jgi:fermentation-respiration switch protein FrsA (DUF1100 family)
VTNTDNSLLLSSVDMFVNIDKISKVNSPVLIIHGDKDDIINIKHGKSLYNEVPIEFRYKPLWLHNANHNNIKLILGYYNFIKTIDGINNY